MKTLVRTLVLHVRAVVARFNAISGQKVREEEKQLGPEAFPSVGSTAGLLC